MYAQACTRTLSHNTHCALKHSQTHTHPLATDCTLTSLWAGQEMLAFLRRSTSVKPSPETTPSTPSCKTSVCSDTAAGDNSAESHSEECGGLSECIQEADVQEAGEGHGGDTLNKKLEDLFKTPIETQELFSFAPSTAG
jgi:hypothetical protein